MVNVHLYDSTVCRLCAAENGNEHLFVSEDGEPDLCSLVNRYLPLKIHNDGKLPQTICPGCNIQLEATVQFFELLVAGQRKLRELWKHQVEQQRKVERFRSRKENVELGAEGVEADSVIQYNDDEQYGQQVIIKVMADGSIYAEEHEMSLQMEGLTKPRRKRGRPPKALAETDSVSAKESPTEVMSQGEEDKQEEEEEVDGDGRRRRKRKVPKRYLEAVQGKELERIFKEEGVIDEEDNGSEMFEGSEALLKSSSQDGGEEVIGHLETEEGTDLGEVVIMNRGRVRSKSKLRRRKSKFTCQLCGRGFLQRSRYIIHKGFHASTKFECTQCKKMFDTKENLTLHQETTKHSSNFAEENVEVQEAQKTNNAKQNTSLKSSEVAKDSSKATYTCEKCNKQFDLKQEYELHMRVAHEQQKFSCSNCNKSFANQSDLKTHMTTHGKTKSDKDYPCDICGKVLNHPSSVLYHKEAEHNNGLRFVCNKCNKCFKHKQLLQRHQLVHSDNRPHVCKSCNASFKTKANLINHQSTHTGQKKYSCEICNQQFAHKTSLTLHYRWHSGQKPYKCKECGKSFSQNGNLQEHIRIHTGEKPYSCDFCGRKFTTSSQFKLHIKRHTGERPWKCEFCSKSFLHKDTWKCHVRRHKGERPFQCNECNRGFTEQWALKKHLRLHTGEKPYSCDVCGKAFADCSNLTKHKKVHRENKKVTVNRPEGSPIGEVWQILPNSQDADDQTFTSEIIATDENSNDGVQQIIYVSYQDPDDPDDSQTLHLVDANMIKNKNEIVTNVNSLSRLGMQSDEIIVDKIMTNSASNNEDSEIELSESDLQLQITDEHGNPIPLSIQEARQLFSQKQFINQLNDSQIVRVHPGMFAQQLQALNIHVDEDDTMEETGIMVRSSANKNIGLSTIQSDAQAIVQALEDESTDATTVATINQLESIEQAGLVDGEQAIEFVTQDGQKVRVLTSYPVDSMQLASEYLTIV
ncbi:PREDICTED: zinc finger protein 271-like [Vollenhovia emeryi]|uniref:zinc finger protein 271-like n=1 Tax=Vollenhovia emeryi TaxID=411798 RepID=UPI0005F47287|nr:PREDICTED: zinc finger protein 271-like [Vollenhovia emeryi]XP_011883065.1 PREDICTED: zinc finger protein 271-like [Vollenhovia emeryi]XP_011883066.1 PREDICTED: zinc finger protein 271-like [Vollenhovia emeryi]XP_011883067.1 PREDICTED: zinc finger protein 271-like [Vollenhovia emeryi]